MAEYVYAIAPGWDGSIETLLLGGRVDHGVQSLHARAAARPIALAATGRLTPSAGARAGR